MAVEPPMSPGWWLRRLEAKLDERRPHVELLTRYYEGDHPLPVPHERLQAAYRRLLRSSRANWTGLIVEAVAERLHVEGFRLENVEGSDADAWALWQFNNLDADSELVHTEALVCGETYVCVWANPTDPTAPPLITPEHPSQMIVEVDPADRRTVLAALKVWEDDLAGPERRKNATLYLPDAIWKFEAPVNSGVWGERAPMIVNPLGEVPVVPFRNRPTLMGGGRSEFEDVIDIQDRINKTIYDRMLASEYAAFRQRYVTGMEIPIDEQGRPKAPFESAVDRLWMAEDPAVQFGEFSPTELGPYIAAVQSDVVMMAAISRTPPHYLLGDLINLSGEALKAAEAGLTSKAAARCRQFGESWERVVRLAFAVVGDPRAKVTDGEVIWRNVETRSEAELTDSLLKMQTLGVPNEALWERWGASQQEIARWKDMMFEQMLAAQAMGMGAEPYGEELPPAGEEEVPEEPL